MAAVVFSAECEPTRGLRHTLEWATDIITSRSRKEQRRSVRPTPVGSVEFMVMGADAREMAHIDALLRSGGVDQFKVPLWHDRQPLAAPAGIGATALAISTPGYGFEVGGEAILWSNPWTWEIVTVSGIAPTSLTVSALTLAWTAFNTLVMPVMAGALVEPVSGSRLSGEGQDASIKFLLTRPYVRAGVADIGAGVLDDDCTFVPV